MSDDSLMVDGRRYLSSKRSAELFGYSTDYVGELCRQGKVACFRKGRQWYVEEKSLFAYLETAREKTVERKHELSRHLSRQLNKKPSPGFWSSLDVSRTLVSRIGAFFVSRRLVRASAGSLLVFALFFAQTPVARAGLEEFSLASILRITRSVTDELAASFRATAVKTGDALATLADGPAVLLGDASALTRSASEAISSSAESVTAAVSASLGETSASAVAMAHDLASFPRDLALSLGRAGTSVGEALGKVSEGVIGGFEGTISRLGESVETLSGAMSASVADTRESLGGISRSAAAAVTSTREVLRRNLLAAIQYEDTFNLIKEGVKDGFDAVIDKVTDTLNRSSSSTLGTSPNGSESASGGGAMSVTPPVPSVPPVPATTSSGTGKTVTERIIERIVRVETPVIQNITQTTPGTVVTGGVSSAALDLRLQQVSNELRAEISRVSGASSAQVSNVFHVMGQATRIDQLSGTVITSPSVSGGTWSGANLTGTTNISSASISALTLGTGTTTASNGFNISAGCFAVNGVCVGSSGGGGGSGDVGSGTAGQFPFYNGTGTTLTATSSIFLTEGGNVGIGTTSPFAKLSVAGAIFANGSITGSDITATGTLSVAGASSLQN
ncbi:helix-turn-helix domain-containing protein, partial [Candidatus Parcubacteria bacterium]|nr:helix-turn-helix domain-containing protein [Candidatus Parcubacteria bacterium]